MYLEDFPKLDRWLDDVTFTNENTGAELINSCHVHKKILELAIANQEREKAIVDLYDELRNLACIYKDSPYLSDAKDLVNKYAILFDDCYENVED